MSVLCFRFINIVLLLILFFILPFIIPCFLFYLFSVFIFPHQVISPLLFHFLVLHLYRFSFLFSCFRFFFTLGISSHLFHHLVIYHPFFPFFLFSCIHSSFFPYFHGNFFFHLSLPCSEPIFLSISAISFYIHFYIYIFYHLFIYFFFGGGGHSYLPLPRFPPQHALGRYSLVALLILFAALSCMLFFFLFIVPSLHSSFYCIACISIHSSGCPSPALTFPLSILLSAFFLLFLLPHIHLHPL